MRISDVLSGRAVACDVKARSKKGVLEALANLIAAEAPELTSVQVFHSLSSRERLGSTGVGRGVAIPHGRVDCGGRPLGAFLSTSGGVEFDAIDNQPVDLFFALLVPNDSTDEHLKMLAQLAEMFSDGDFVTSLRACKSPDRLYALLTAWAPRA